MVGFPFRDVRYCRYSDGVSHTYRKRTRLWGVLPTFVPRPLCLPSNPCEFSKETKRHPTVAQRFSNDPSKRMILNMLYSMPKALCDDVAKAAWELRG